MQLSDKLFVEIVGVAGDDTYFLAPQDERRASPRANLGCRARIFPLLEASANVGQPVLVRDISVHGIGILASEPMTSGDEFVIRLPTVSSSFGSEPVQIQCAVRRCQPGGTGNTQFFIGSTFELVLNRPLAYAVHLPAETSDDAAAVAVPEVAWDPFAASAVEKRFDVQTTESMLHRPQREPIKDQLSQYLIARMIGRLLLMICSPILKIARALGIHRSISLTSFKIRARLARNRTGKVRTLKELADRAAAESADEKEKADSATRPQTYAERSILTALDSASHYVQGIEDTLPPPPASTSLTGLEKRVSLFAIAGTIEPSPAVTGQSPHENPDFQIPQQASVIDPAQFVSVEPSALPVVVSLIVPTFELPAILPIDAPAVSEPLPATPPLQATDHLVHELLSVPNAGPGPVEPKKTTSAAWRSRHRSVSNSSARDRPKLGR